jgi:hypothetical protein
MCERNHPDILVSHPCIPPQISLSAGLIGCTSEFVKTNLLTIFFKVCCINVDPERE